MGGLRRALNRIWGQFRRFRPTAVADSVVQASGAAAMLWTRHGTRVHQIKASGRDASQGGSRHDINSTRQVETEAKCGHRHRTGLAVELRARKRLGIHHPNGVQGHAVAGL